MRNLFPRSGFFDFDLRGEISAIFVKIRQNLNLAPKFRSPIFTHKMALNSLKMVEMFTVCPKHTTVGVLAVFIHDFGKSDIE